MSFDESLETFLERLREVYADKRITLAELWSVILGLIEFASSLATNLANSGSEKQTLILSWVGKAFDILWPRVAFPLAWAWLRPIVSPVVRVAFLAISQASTEYIYRRVVSREDAKPTITPEVQS